MPVVLSLLLTFLSLIPFDAQVLASNLTSSSLKGTAVATSPSRAIKIDAIPVTVTIPQTTTALFAIPNGSIDTKGDMLYSVYTVTGPTTFTAVGDFAGDPSGIVWPLIETQTTTLTVDEGSLMFNAIEGTTYSVVTLFGPTTATIVGTQPGDNFAPPFIAYDNTADPGCYSTMDPGLDSSFQADHTVIRKSPVTTLTAGQTITTQFIDGHCYNTNYAKLTFSGPTTVYCTMTDHLVAPQFVGGPLYNPPKPPGQRCGGQCGSCMLFYPLVTVHYWPVSDANTACLSASHNSSTLLALDTSTASGLTVRRRGISELPAGVSTLVSDGFTYTSPSVYIVFPTINAADFCGYIGSVHTSVTLSFPPEQIFTAILFDTWNTSYYPFNFADAQCPPSSLTAVNEWINIGISGNYNPVISAPAGLSMLDPAWNQDCILAPFQGNDPPYALVPASNPVPDPTTTAPVNIPTPATPISGFSALPKQTESTKDPALPKETEATKDPASPPPIQTEAAKSQVFTTDSLSVSIIASQSLRPGTVAIISGSLVSMTQPWVITTARWDITIASQMYTADKATNFIISGQTLEPGQVITISQTAVTIPDSPQASSALGAFTYNGQTFTANSASEFIIGSKTLSPGGIITLSGTPISLAIGSSQVDVVVGSSTQLLGDIIMGAFNGPSSSNRNGTSIVPFTGEAGRLVIGLWIVGDVNMLTAVGVVGLWLLILAFAW